MSLINFSLSLSHFNINISIKKDVSKRNCKLMSTLKQELLIKKAMENIDAAQVKYHYFNSVM